MEERFLRLAKLTLNLSLLVFKADLVVVVGVCGCILFGVEQELLDEVVVSVCALLVTTASLDIGSTLFDTMVSSGWARFGRV